ncbi:hypothetical protein BOFL111202_12500 [Bordetella flabilis]
MHIHIHIATWPLVFAVVIRVLYAALSDRLRAYKSERTRAPSAMERVSTGTARTLLRGIPAFNKEKKMSDDLKDRGPRDRSRISLEQEHELRYWTKELGVTPEQLRQAVKDAGSNSVDKVRAILKK